MEKKYTPPPITWLKMTDYTHGWLQHELGAAIRIRNQRVVCVQHLPGAREILRMETVTDLMEPGGTGSAMSATRRNCINAGMVLDAQTVEKMYGVKREELQLYVPIECPRLCLTKNGVLRRWTLDVCFSRKQANALQKLLREAFWSAVEEFDASFAEQYDGQSYPAVEMVEAFCDATHTSMVYVDTIRREWQRRVKRKAGQTGRPS